MPSRKIDRLMVAIAAPVVAAVVAPSLVATSACNCRRDSRGGCGPLRRRRARRCRRLRRCRLRVRNGADVALALPPVGRRLSRSRGPAVAASGRSPCDRCGGRGPCPRRPAAPAGSARPRLRCWRCSRTALERCPPGRRRCARSRWTLERASRAPAFRACAAAGSPACSDDVIAMLATAAVMVLRHGRSGGGGEEKEEGEFTHGRLRQCTLFH